jgi:hypothetical protein
MDAFVAIVEAIFSGVALVIVAWKWGPGSRPPPPPPGPTA